MASLDIKSLAEKHCRDFANVNKNSTAKDTAGLAVEYVKFFNPTVMTMYSFGGTQTYKSVDPMYKNMQAWLDSLAKLGVDPWKGISMKDIRVEVYSSRVAFCWITNVFTPANGEPLECVLFHSYRVPVGQEKGFWEFIITDRQLEVFSEKVPGFFEGEGAPIDTSGERELP